MDDEPRVPLYRSTPIHGWEKVRAWTLIIVSPFLAFGGLWFDYWTFIHSR